MFDFVENRLFGFKRFAFLLNYFLEVVEPDNYLMDSFAAGFAFPKLGHY